MPAGGFVLSFTGLPGDNAATIANLTAHELKQRGCNVETRDVVLIATNSITSETPENLRGNRETFVEVTIGKSTNQGDEGQNAVEDEHVTKIVLSPDAEPGQCVADLLAKLETLDLIAAPVPKDSSYDEDDEAMIRSRLEALGYL